jgi:hypothetical protein
MKALCAWCQSEGRPDDLGERESLDNPAPTHCICPHHRERLLELLPSRSFPDVELLVIVRRNDTELFEYLQGRFAGERGVRVILDRRMRDRRRDESPVTDERRRVRTRRIRSGDVSPLGYTIVRFTPAATAQSAPSPAAPK